MELMSEPSGFSTVRRDRVSEHNLCHMEQEGKEKKKRNNKQSACEKHIFQPITFRLHPRDTPNTPFGLWLSINH